MKGIIKFLSNNIISQIAAGQTFYNPAIIIKELVENSIDAKSDVIDIVLINSGKNIIKILDNGIGMNKYDASICFKKYATSKIEKIEDLKILKTNGFRGEALSYISSISQIEIITKDINSDVGIQIFLDRSVIKKCNPIQVNIGTNIIVKNIFFNFPVRRSFLKSDKIELYNIINEFIKIAISNININFRLFNNHKMIFNLKKSSLKERILSIFSDKKADYLVPILYEKNNLIINGFITKPSYYINNKYEQLIFINNKYASNKDLYKNIRLAYEGFLKKNRYPSCFIFLYMDSEKLFNNIVYDKNIFFIKDEKLIKNSIKNSIKNALYNNILKIDITNITKENEEKNNNLVNKFENDYLLKNKIHFYDNYHKKDIYKDLIFKNFNKVIQICKKYIITNYNSNLLIIDQHRAHQRILYDKYKKLLIDNNIKKIKIIPLKINLTYLEIEKLKLLIFELEKIGFTLLIYKYYAIVKSVPIFFKKDILLKLINNLLDNIDTNISYNYQKLILINLVKITAIKRGVTLSNVEIIYIIKKLFLCKKHFISPFKKKIYLYIDSLEKYF